MSNKKPKNDISQTIEYLEQEYWGDLPVYDSYLVTTVYKLRKKNLNEFPVEDLRIVIGQNLSLPILIPMAIDVLEEDILAAGDLYEGALLQYVLNVKPNFWKDYPELKTKLKKIFLKNQQRIKQHPDIGEKDKKKLFERYNEFSKGEDPKEDVL